MENIISYFGTYTPAADGAIANFKFEYLCTLGFAAIVIFLGRAIVAHSAALRNTRFLLRLFPVSSFTPDFRDQDDRHSQYQF